MWHKQAAKENMKIERDNALLSGAASDKDGLVGIPVSYEIEWQKRGKGHNSFTGQWTRCCKWDYKMERFKRMLPDVNFVERIKMLRKKAYILDCIIVEVIILARQRL